jgi:hypothetical protein
LQVRLGARREASYPWSAGSRVCPRSLRPAGRSTPALLVLLEACDVLGESDFAGAVWLAIRRTNTKAACRLGVQAGVEFESGPTLHLCHYVGWSETVNPLYRLLNRECAGHAQGLPRQRFGDLGGALPSTFGSWGSRLRRRPRFATCDFIVGDSSRKASCWSPWTGVSALRVPNSAAARRERHTRDPSRSREAARALRGKEVAASPRSALARHRVKPGGLDRAVTLSVRRTTVSGSPSPTIGRARDGKHPSVRARKTGPRPGRSGGGPFARVRPHDSGRAPFRRFGGYGDPMWLGMGTTECFSRYLHCLRGP